MGRNSRAKPSLELQMRCRRLGESCHYASRTIKARRHDSNLQPSQTSIAIVTTLRVVQARKKFPCRLPCTGDERAELRHHELGGSQKMGRNSRAKPSLELQMRATTRRVVPTMRPVQSRHAATTRTCSRAKLPLRLLTTRRVVQARKKFPCRLPCTGDERAELRHHELGGSQKMGRDSRAKPSLELQMRAPRLGESCHYASRTIKVRRHDSNLQPSQTSIALVTTRRVVQARKKFPCRLPCTGDERAELRHHELGGSQKMGRNSRAKPSLELQMRPRLGESCHHASRTIKARRHDSNLQPSQTSIALVTTLRVVQARKKFPCRLPCTGDERAELRHHELGGSQKMGRNSRAKPSLELQMAPTTRRVVPTMRPVQSRHAATTRTCSRAKLPLPCHDSPSRASA